MDLAWLRDFEALAEAGNFSRAAEARHVTQPAFSRRIRALEDWAGAPLFERGSQPIALTEAGRRIRPLLADIVRRLDDAREEAGIAAAASLRFAATHALSFSVFPTWLRSVERHLPAVPIRLVSDGLDACERLMQAGRVEFLICHHHDAAPTGLAEPGFTSVRIGEDRLRLVCAPSAEGEALFSALDPAASVLGYGAGSGLGRILSALGMSGARKPNFTSHLAATLRSMARDGRGLAWLPESLVAADLAEGVLVPAKDAPLPIPIAIRIIRSAKGAGRHGDAFWTKLVTEARS
ncbi:LysR family transcriptional regulator [Enterovirga rhinocerotis]|uniref:DNA-binding transcriptional LysR family regulator n=1 Tax=Enterovirga rhinocerotis TaxID=1339210 RepID=A0A4R7C7A5_9HYPH|nr:LysR family transcriptional regulator [Enterovirga rhinocerotis]TDR94151.1 DNA-binding transcriptional LysR family regulator [Enterovirga rhinocerotis]